MNRKDPTKASCGAEDDGPSSERSPTPQKTPNVTLYRVDVDFSSDIIFVIDDNIHHTPNLVEMCSGAKLPHDDGKRDDEHRSLKVRVCKRRGRRKFDYWRISC